MKPRHWGSDSPLMWRHIPQQRYLRLYCSENQKTRINLMYPHWLCLVYFRTTLFNGMSSRNCVFSDNWNSFVELAVRNLTRTFICSSFMKFSLSHSFAALIERLHTAGNRIDRLLIELIRSVRDFCLYLYMFTFYSRFESLTAIESIKSSRADNGIRCFMSTKWFQTTWLGPRKVLLNYFAYIPAYWIYFITFW